MAILSAFEHTEIYRIVPAESPAENSEAIEIPFAFISDGPRYLLHIADLFEANTILCSFNTIQPSIYFYTRIFAVDSSIAQRAYDAVRVINRLSYDRPRWCQLDSSCDYDHQTSTTTEVVGDISYSSVSAPSWTLAPVADGHRFSAVKRRLLDRSENAVFTYPPAFSAPIWMISSEFCRELLWHKTIQSWAIVRRCFF